MVKICVLLYLLVITVTNAAPKRRWRVSGGGGYSDGEPGLSGLEIIFIVISALGVLISVISCCIKLGACGEQDEDDEQETQETAQNEFGHYGFAKANSGYLPDQGTNVQQTQHI